MRIAAIGAGRIGQAHIATLSRVDRIDELLVADLDQVRAKRAAGLVGARAVTIDEVFASAPDGIVISTPTSAHKDLILRGAQAGIPTFCEKPVAENLAATRKVVAEIQDFDTPIQIGFQRRFDPGYIAAKKALQAGKLGELRRVHMLTCDPEPPPAEYIPTSGGLYQDCHIHDFDILRWVTGLEADYVFMAGANRGAPYFGASNDVDESAGLVVMTDGTLVTLQGSRYNGAGYDVRMELAGTSGQRSVGLDYKAPLHSAEAAVTFPDGTPWPNFQTRFQVAYTKELEHFVSVAAGEFESPCTPADSLEALYIAEAADLSRREGRPVSIHEVRV